MAWYIYLIHFLDGFFLVNGVPHFVMGVCGETFPSPFAKPPGKGESSAVVNAVWGSFNFAVGAVLLWFFWPQGEEGPYRWAVIGLGGFVMALFLAKHFGSQRIKKR